MRGPRGWPWRTRSPRTARWSWSRTGGRRSQKRGATERRSEGDPGGTRVPQGVTSIFKGHRLWSSRTTASCTSRRKYLRVNHLAIALSTPSTTRKAPQRP